MENSALIWPLIARVLNGEASPEEQQQLYELLRQDESLMQQFDLLNRIWKENHSHLELEDRDAARDTVSRIITKAESDAVEPQPEIPVQRTRITRRKIWMAAASVLLLVSAGWLWLGNTTLSEPALRAEAIEAKRGSRSKSILPDGTTVWLNAGSRLTYTKDFSGNTREVILEGEGFFDVVKQPDRPFIVHTSGIDIKVLGTAFNVKSYPEDKTVETTLYRGSVKVFRQKESEEAAIQLKPNEKLILLKQAANNSQATNTEARPLSSLDIPTIAKIDSTKQEHERLETAWVYSRLEFRGDNFEDLARKLERWYNVSVIFNDEKAKQLNFYGSFENESVSQAFAALKVAVPLFNYTIKGHEIYIDSINK